ETMSWRSGRGPRAEPGDRRRRGLATLRTVGQVWVLAVVSVVAVVGLSVATLARASDLRSSQDRAVRQLVPAVRALGRTRTAFALLASDYRAILDAPTDPATLLKLTDANTEHAIAAMSRWNVYRTLPPRVPDEVAARERFESLERRRYELLT